MRALVIVSLVLFALRLWAATHVGFGDSEALYASWAVHPQPAYLDHPGLVGVLARAIGEGGIPSPTRTHVVTSILATLVPWLVVAVARVAGARREHAATAGLVVAVVPQIAVGLFALTPDLLLAPLWLGSLGLAIVAVSSGASTTRAPIALVGAGLLAGAAAAAKVSGILLMSSLAAAYLWIASTPEHEPEAEARARSMRSIWPWAGLASGVVVLVPVAFYETHLGFPMLHHRLVETQAGSGIQLKNVAALFGGQLTYLSPIVAWLALVVAIDLFRHRHDDAVSRILFVSFALPLLPLVLLSLWSPVAEPHWIAPPLLALPIHAARRPFAKASIVRVGAGVAAAFTLAAHLWVLLPVSSLLVPSSVDPKLDIANELYGWPTAIEAVREQMRAAATPFDPEGREVVVVGPHWTVCAQLHSALPGVRVGCATPIPDDFDRWFARDAWRRSDDVLFVTDNRFPGDGAEQLPAHVRVAQQRVRVLRGARTSRVFDLYLYSHHSNARADEKSP